jgi:6-phosphogluconolactonase
MTLTLPALNRARRILWLVKGEDRADAVAGLARGDAALPASRIRRESALQLADRAAAARVELQP